MRYWISDLWTTFKYRPNRNIISVGIMVVAVIIVIAVVMIPRAIDTTHERREWNQFVYQSSENHLYDFNYLMSVLEENWPFFNLSMSANGVDVHEVADNVRYVLQSPEAEGISVFAFLDLLREHFIWEIGQIGHLNTIWQYEDYFGALEHKQWVRNFTRALPHNVAMFQEIFTKPETVMFYEILRDIGGSTLRSPSQAQIESETLNLPVLETEILEEGRIAYLAVNQMINVWDDHWIPSVGMGRYQHIMHNFHTEIEGFEHLIIDMRGNLGGVNHFFNLFIAGPLLSEGMTLPMYVHYMGGDHSRRLRENHDLRMWGIYTTEGFNPQVANFIEPLPYLDTNIIFPYVHKSEYATPAGYLLYEFYGSGTEEVLFDGTIWMLVDENTASAAESAVAMFKLNNFATVVGETTRGLFGTSNDPTVMIMSLPNTGILVRFDVAYFTDRLGRPFQGYGITPHYFNRPNMDALETVLAMIEEREGH